MTDVADIENIANLYFGISPNPYQLHEVETILKSPQHHLFRPKPPRGVGLSTLLMVLTTYYSLKNANTNIIIFSQDTNVRPMFSDKASYTAFHTTQTETRISFNGAFNNIFSKNYSNLLTVKRYPGSNMEIETYLCSKKEPWCICFDARHTHIGNVSIINSHTKRSLWYTN